MISEKTYYELKLFENGPLALDGKLTQRMNDLIATKYIVPNTVTTIQTSPNDWTIGVPVDYKLSDRGIDALKEFEDDSSRKASEAKDKRANRNIAVAALIVGVLTLLATVFGWRIG